MEEEEEKDENEKLKSRAEGHVKRKMKSIYKIQ